MNKRILFILAGLLIVLTLQNISSIGITPGRTTLDFEPSLQKEIQFSIINSESKDMSVVFTVNGDLSESVTLTQTYAELSSTEESKPFTYAVNLPQKISEPGLHETQIYNTEVNNYGVVKVEGDGILAELVRIQPDATGVNCVIQAEVR